MRATLVLLIGGFCLIGAGAAGLAASPLLAAGFLALTLLLWGVATSIESSPVGRYDPARFLADVPLGPAVAFVVTLAWLDASAGELQTLGGVVGLLGMANYFLRPVYFVAVRLARRVASL